MPFDVAKATSPGVERLNQGCVGGRVRFTTDSSYIAIRVKFLAVGRSPHIPLVGTAGFARMADTIGTFIKHILSRPF